MEVQVSEITDPDHGRKDWTHPFDPVRDSRDGLTLIGSFSWPFSALFSNLKAIFVHDSSDKFCVPANLNGYSSVSIMRMIGLHCHNLLKVSLVLLCLLRSFYVECASCDAQRSGKTALRKLRMVLKQATGEQYFFSSPLHGLASVNR